MDGPLDLEKNLMGLTEKTHIFSKTKYNLTNLYENAHVKVEE